MASTESSPRAPRALTGRVRRPLASALLALGLAAGCASGPPDLKFERFDYALTPGTEQYPDVGGVVLLDRGVLTFTVEPEQKIPIARLRRWTRMKVLRPERLPEPDVRVTYDPGTAIGVLIAQITKPDGSFRRFDDIVDLELTDGRRMKRVRMPKLEPGDVVEHAYDLYFKDLRFIPSWAFQAELPTQRSEFVTVAPTGFDVDYRFTENGEVKARAPERFELERETRLSWSLAETPALFAEPQRPDAERLVPRAHVLFVGATVAGQRFEGFRSWDDVRRWFFEERAGPWSQLDPSQIAEAERLTQGLPSEEKALKLLEVVARDLPWPSAAPPPLWRAPITSAGQTLSRQSGDRTTRGLLLAALLRAVGVDAIPAFYARRDHALLIPDFPVVRDVEGVGVLIPRAGRPIFLDPASLVVSGDVPAPEVQGTRVIGLRDDNAEVVTLVGSEPKDSRASIAFDLKLEPTGRATGKLEARLTGAIAGEVREQLLRVGVERYAGIVREGLRRFGVVIPIDDVTVADLAALRRPLVVRGTVTLGELATLRGDTTATFPVSRLLGAVGPDELPPRRRHAMSLGAPTLGELAVTVILPEGWRPETFPPPLEQQFEGGRHKLEIRQETPTRLGFRATLETRAYELAREAYPAFYRLRESAERLLSSEVVLTKPPPKRYEF